MPPFFIRNSFKGPSFIRVSLFVVRPFNNLQIGLVAVYKKKLIFDKATDALFMFVKISDFLRRCNAVQTSLMAVTSNTNCFHASKTFQAFPPFQIKSR